MTTKAIPVAEYEAIIVPFPHMKYEKGPALQPVLSLISDSEELFKTVPNMLNKNLSFQNVLSVIVVAIRANSVRKLRLVALRANGYARCYHLHVLRLSHISFRFRCFPLRNCHLQHLLVY